MPLSWNEIRQRSIAFTRNWGDPSTSARERAEAQTFWNEFFEVFGIRRRTVASFEAPVRNLTGNYDFIDLLWPGTLIAEHKSLGRDLAKAHTQAIGYIHSLHTEGRQHEAPRYIIVSDFGRIALHDLEPDDPDAPTTIEFPLQEFPNHIRHFAFIAGYETRRIDPEDPANIEAAELLAELHDTLKAGGYPEHDLERFMVRILFCLFAEDTHLFGEPDAFTLYIKNSTREDGSDLGFHLAGFFDVLNTRRDQRQANLDEQLADLPFVNGDLFADRLPPAGFNRDMRNQLLACCNFQWTTISPAVFGSLFQSIMEGPDRRQIGAHYTSERDIMKLIRSLFLDELRQEFERAKNVSKPAIRRFHEKIGSLKFLDPACGCGNFLVIAFRELRLLELDILKALHPQREVQARLDFDLRGELTVSVDQMYGIEIGEWPARIAEVAMWLMDHQINMEVSKTFGEFVARLPLENSPHIRCGNALRIDWNDVLPASECTYVLGNPPFVGHHYQSDEQKEDQALVMRGVDGYGVLDYVANWYVKAARYIQGTEIQCAFVSTNSICQGEQAGILWSYLFTQHNLRINFGHRTFSWTSEARGRAHVHVVIVGFGVVDKTPKVIHDYDTDEDHPTVTQVRNISPYLVEGPDRAVRNRSRPICDVPRMIWGNKPTDGGNLILSPSERDQLLRDEPAAAEFVRPFLSGGDFLNGRMRYCLWLVNADPARLRCLNCTVGGIDGCIAMRGDLSASPARRTMSFRRPGWRSSAGCGGLMTRPALGHGPIGS